MNKASFQAWVSVHRWSGLICTLFLLVICLTGLPLIFNDEIGGWLDASAPYARVAADAPAARLDGLLAIARQRYPDQIVMSTFVDDDEPQVIVGLVPSWDRYRRDHHVLHFVKFDAHSAAVLRDDAQSGEAGRGFLSFLLNLHRDMFAGLAGDLFLGVMALFFIVAVISGVVLYGPFMKRLSFGSIRVRRSVRLSVLDMHNLLGIVLTAWMGGDIGSFRRDGIC
ncbi:MAG: PepSY-associated TM helix domain-containing protein [Acetobacter sp.]|uniref:PepSY-associated TM helix domain-containing protein n=1 Tax=Acetobacter sp. TaxID=440 RepID=UPI0039E76362